jgi:hypothetical protein
VTAPGGYLCNDRVCSRTAVGFCLSGWPIAVVVLSQLKTHCVQVADSMGGRWSPAARQHATIIVARQRSNAGVLLRYGPGIGISTGSNSIACEQRGTRDAVVWRMAIMLISWVCISVVFCLAFLGAAACPAPRFDEGMAAGSTAGLQQQGLGVVFQDARLASPQPEGALPPSCQAA